MSVTSVCLKSRDIPLLRGNNEQQQQIQFFCAFLNRRETHPTVKLTKCVMRIQQEDESFVVGKCFHRTKDALISFWIL